MRHVFLLPCLSFALIAQTPIEVKPTVLRVRLQPDEAWITCGGTVPLAKAGKQSIRLTGLPKDLNLDSIRISLKGGDGARLGEVQM